MAPAAGAVFLCPNGAPEKPCRLSGTGRRWIDGRAPGAHVMCVVSPEQSRSMFLSVFDVFKIGVGPSSSHTMGPMSAAVRFLDEIAGPDWPRPAGAKVAQIKASLHGSLAFTGVGHGTGRAVILGLTGELPDQVDPDRMDAIIDGVEKSRMINPPGHPGYQFDPKADLVFDKKNPLPGHANGMTFSPMTATVADAVAPRLLFHRRRLCRQRGPNWKRVKAEAGRSKPSGVPYPFRNAAEMLQMAKKSGLSIRDETGQRGSRPHARGTGRRTRCVSGARWTAASSAVCMARASCPAV
jgi:hypothetical protein